MIHGHRGAVAGGSRLTVEAGLRALRLGGNAVDAAIAATLMATVAEPLLTGLGGAGLALVRMDGAVRALDFFTAMPGIGHQGPPPPVTELAVDFGVTTQVFHTGPGSIAVPGLPWGVAALHEAHATLPLDELAAPAIAAAREGVLVSPVFATVASLLWPILGRDPEVARRLGPDGRGLQVGERFAWPDMATALTAFCHAGADFFRGGEAAARLFEAFGPHTRLTPEDLASYKPRWTSPLRFSYRDASVWVPGPPSVAGLLVLSALRALEEEGELPPDAFGAEAVLRLARAQRASERFRDDDLTRRLFAPGFLSEAAARLGADQRGAGFTTHISATDAAGNAVAITHSLGETCGAAIPGLGVLLNNFLGEADVNPPEAPRRPGERMFTMCCPTLIQRGDRVIALGTGGSNRIRSAILHGVVYLVDVGLEVEQAVSAPRAHVERGVLHVEAAGRDERAVNAVLSAEPDAVVFPERHLFFGGLHVAATDPDGFVGAGDGRRSGAWGRV